MWIHLDFANVQYINRILTEKYLSKADKIVCVSTECLKNFNTLFPNLSTKSVYLPNINSSEYIKEKSLETLDDDNLKHVKNCLKFKIISVCRLSIYHKHCKFADELFLQTVIWNSPYRNTLYREDWDDDYRSCLRYIDWNRGRPYIFLISDKKELDSVDGFLFARKFDDKILLMGGTFYRK